VIIGAVVALLVVVAGVFVVLRPQEYRVVVPAGTGARIDSGEAVELIPRDLALSVGDTMVIENQDARNHTVGPFAVRAGETLDYTFSSSGIFKGACTVHPSGEVTITVT
jgi:plastocyanin